MPKFTVTRRRWFQQVDTLQIEASSPNAASLAAFHSDSPIDHEYLEEDRTKHEILAVKRAED